MLIYEGYAEKNWNFLLPLNIRTNDFHTWTWQRRIMKWGLMTLPWWLYLYCFMARMKKGCAEMRKTQQRNSVKSLHWHVVLWLPHLMHFCSRLSRGCRSIWSKYTGNIRPAKQVRKVIRTRWHKPKSSEYEISLSQKFGYKMSLQMDTELEG